MLKSRFEIVLFSHWSRHLTQNNSKSYSKSQDCANSQRRSLKALSRGAHAMGQHALQVGSAPFLSSCFPNSATCTQEQVQCQMESLPQQPPSSQRVHRAREPSAENRKREKDWTKKSKLCNLDFCSEVDSPCPSPSKQTVILLLLWPGLSNCSYTSPKGTVVNLQTYLLPYSPFAC